MLERILMWFGKMALNRILDWIKEEIAIRAKLGKKKAQTKKVVKEIRNEKDPVKRAERMRRLLNSI